MGRVYHRLLTFLLFAGFLCEFYVFGASLGNADADIDEDGETNSASTLKFLVLVTRHGNRPPLYPVANDEYPKSNKTYWPFGDGLTKVGRQQLYDLGVKLRSMYKDFLGTQFFNDEIRVSSTDVERVIQSGKLLMAGLFTPTKKQIWNKDLMWQPVPVHLDSLDKTVTSGFLCKKFETIQATVKSAFATKWADSITYFMDYVSNATNSTVSGTFGAVKIWDMLLSEDVEGYTLPDWAAEIYPDAMYPMMNDMYVQYVSGTDELTRLVIGPFFAEMMDVIESKINGTLSPDRKMFYWSGHDDTLITLQAAIGLAQDDIVGVVTPGSAMTFEVHQHKRTKKYFIKVYYINGLDSNLEAKRLKIPKCGTSCNFDKFKTLVAKFTNVTGDTWSQECRS